MEVHVAGLTHLGVGLASKRIVPKVPLPVLIVAAYAIDIVWGVFFALGVEQYPGAAPVEPSPWSHGLFMSVVWSLLGALIAWLASRNARTSAFIGLLVFSHWVVDWIAKPMLSAFPNDVGLPLLFAGSPLVGLGLWSNPVLVAIGEYGVTLVGAVLYVLTLAKLRRERRAVAPA